MRRALSAFYRSLPVQLFLLHGRKAQMLLTVWLVVFSTVGGAFAARFGADTLFLAPEYNGHISVLSMALLGGAVAIFVMAWNITTFIIHSKRIPYLGAARQAFVKYCINNAALPGLFLLFYTVFSVRYMHRYEALSAGKILLLQAGFLLGFALLLSLAFLYFFRVDRDLLKTVLARMADPSRIREIIPYDSLDVELDLIRADTYLTERLGVARTSELDRHPHRLLTAVLRRHHRNATVATLAVVLLLVLMGTFGAGNPTLRIPAGAGFLLLFSVLTAALGAMRYFLKSWEFLGWMLLLLIIAGLVGRSAFDLRSVAPGLYYGERRQPVYDYSHLAALFTPARCAADAQTETARLARWKARVAGDTAFGGGKKPPIIVVTVSGGGSRSAYWTFRALQHLDSASGGKLWRHTVFLTGASGGTFGAAYWRAVHEAADAGKLPDRYSADFQERIGRDLLNAVIFSFATIDLGAPFRQSTDGVRYTRDRGHALEAELVRNSGGLLDRSFADLHTAESAARIPAMVISPTIVNDGRKLLMSPLPVAYLTRPAFSLADSFSPPIDAVDFGAFFAGQNPGALRLASALRINATFPYILPTVRMPSTPQMNLMDAGLRDNFGTETAVRYLQVFRGWMQEHCGEIILLQIRDTREHEVFPPTEQGTLPHQVTDPATVIQHKWEPFQSYTLGYLRDAATADAANRLRVVTLQYIPRVPQKSATLNFHLSAREKTDLYRSVDHPENRAAEAELLRLLR